jgi:perosamine synthetase
MEALRGARCFDPVRPVMSDNFIPISKPNIGSRERQLVLDALDSGWVSSIGKYIDEFEQKFASYCRTEYALAVSNGTTGLHLALATLGIKAGDEVIIPEEVGRACGRFPP